MRDPILSFIIPAYNEEGSLPHTIDSIKNNVPESLPYQVIIADNGSSDNTAKIAREMGALVVTDGHATVAGLRNMGVENATGTVFVFLDADVQLTEQWSRAILDTYSKLVENPAILTGSRCSIPDDASRIETCWFMPLSRNQGNYINSGHLIVHRTLFEHIGGFNSNLQTGEDYQFSIDAKALEADICPDISLRVIHTGYPRTLLQFIKREIWHGMGDCRPFTAILKSKVALISILFTAGIIASFIALAMSLVTPGAIGLLISIIVCSGMAIFRHHVKTPQCLMAVSLLYYAYFISRSISCIAVMLTTSGDRHHR